MLKTRSEGPIEVVALSGDIDSSATPVLRNELTDLVDSGNPLLILNLSKVRFVDSSALFLFVTLLKRCRAVGGDIALVGPNPTVRSIIQLTRLHRVLGVFEDEALAIGRMMPN
ncbi:MAG: STAS domain-containing protein [Acidobacteriota bacterium]